MSPDWRLFEKIALEKRIAPSSILSSSLLWALSLSWSKDVLPQARLAAGPDYILDQKEKFHKF